MAKVTKVFMHWVGELKGDINNPLKDVVRKDPLWFPEEKPDDATLLATEVFEDEVEFIHGVWKGTARIGPVNGTIGINVKFKGKIEYWVVEKEQDEDN